MAQYGVHPSPVAAALQPFVDSGALAGAVTLVATPEKIVALDTVGQADPVSGRAMTPDTIFWVASITKAFTGTLAAMLVEEGTLDPDAPVDAYLPEFRGQQVVIEQTDARQVLAPAPRLPTVGELLSHASGLPFMSRPEQQTGRIDTRPLREAVLTYALTPLQTPPGTKHAYSNAGTNTAGRIIDVIAGKPYELFLQERLLDPLGMRDTTFHPSAEQLKRMVTPHRPDETKTRLVATEIEQLTYPLVRADRYACPAGGLFSTASDLARLGQLVLNGGTFGGRRLLKEATVRMMTTTTRTGTLVNEGKSEAGFGLGWGTASYGKGSAAGTPPGDCGHGAAYGSNLHIDAARRLVMVYLVQQAGFPGVEGGTILNAFRAAAATLA